jgi:cytochrome P450
MFTRFCLTDLEYKGVQFKTGDKIGLMLGAANHDPKRFPEPGKFIPTRENAASHTSLGGGIHFCVGAPLARLEMQIALPILFQRLPGLRLAAIPVYADRYHFHGLERLNAVW